MLMHRETDNAEYNLLFYATTMNNHHFFDEKKITFR